MMRRKARSILRAVRDAFVQGLQAYGATTCGVHLDPGEPGGRQTAPAGPAPGHPERVRPDVPPDDRELQLWAQLLWPDVRRETG